MRRLRHAGSCVSGRGALGVASLRQEQLCSTAKQTHDRTATQVGRTQLDRPSYADRQVPRATLAGGTRGDARRGHIIRA